MGDIHSEEKRDVVLELKLPALSSPQQDLVLKAALSYFNVITYTLETVTSHLIIDRKGTVTASYNIYYTLLNTNFCYKCLILYLLVLQMINRAQQKSLWIYKGIVSLPPGHLRKLNLWQTIVSSLSI